MTNVHDRGGQMPLFTPATTDQTLTAAREQWLAAAASEEREASFLESIGKPYGSTEVYHIRAAVYRETAASLQ